MATALNRGGDTAISTVDGSASAVNWAPVFAGAIVAIATTLILFALGSGLGFAAASPWPGTGPSVTTFAVGIGIWLIVTQWLSSALGGYITGRLRTRWTGIHTHEVVFRDTAHGLLAWAVASSIIGAVALTATASSAGATANGATVAVNDATDTMLRTAHPVVIETDARRTEILRLLTRTDKLQDSDKSYLAAQVAAQTGVSVPEAQQRVDDALTSIRQAADKARKAASALAFFTALSMLIGAFIASAAAAYAGSLRDERADLVSRA